MRGLSATVAGSPTQGNLTRQWHSGKGQDTWVSVLRVKRGKEAHRQYPEVNILYKKTISSGEYSVQKYNIEVAHRCTIFLCHLDLEIQKYRNPNDNTN